jgi:hypothetical protein
LLDTVDITQDVWVLQSSLVSDGERCPAEGHIKRVADPVAILAGRGRPTMPDLDNFAFGFETQLRPSLAADDERCISVRNLFALRATLRSSLTADGERCMYALQVSIDVPYKLRSSLTADGPAQRILRAPGVAILTRRPWRALPQQTITLNEANDELRPSPAVESQRCCR